VIPVLARRAPTMLGQMFNPAANARAIREGLALLRTHTRLIVEMAKEDLAGRYRGQILGSAWVLIHPLAITLLYLFIFGVVFAQRIGGTRELPLDYTTYLLAGLIPWLTFQGAMTTTVNAITSNAALVKQFVFPIEALPARDVASSTVIWFVGIISTLIYVVATQHVAMATWVLLPVLLPLELLAMIGTGLLFSAIAVFVRDLKDFINLFCLIAMFLMPVFYLPGWVPPIFKPLMWVNPFTYMTWVYQDTIYFGRIDHPAAWVVFFIGSPFVFAWGVRLFRSTKPLFSTVL